MPFIGFRWLRGVADSAPYLHHGRAKSLHDAIRLDGGEAAGTVARYGKRSRTDRAAPFGILRSLTAAAGGRKVAAIEAVQARSR